jgi:hypothetical protein
MLEEGGKGGSTESMSMLQYDIKVGRPTEVSGYLNGLVVQRGREANVPTPANEVIIRLHEQVERRELPWDMSNLALVERELGRLSTPSVAV